MAKVRFLWSTTDANDQLYPFCIIKCDKEIASEIIRKLKRGDYEGGWKFIADKLHERYPDKFPTYFDDYNSRRLFWYYNVLEDYDAGYERMMEEVIKILDDNFDYDDEEILREAAKWQVDKELEDLPVYMIK